MRCWPDSRFRPSTSCSSFLVLLCASLCLIASLGPHDHVTEHMMKLHWLPLRQHISFKLYLMMHAAVTGQCPSYIHDIITPFCQLYLDVAGFMLLSLANSTFLEQELFLGTSILRWLVNVSVTLFHLI